MKKIKGGFDGAPAPDPDQRGNGTEGAAMPALPQDFDARAARLQLMAELTRAISETRLVRVRAEQKRKLHLDALRVRAYCIQVYGKLLFDHTLADLEARIKVLEERMENEK